MSAARQLTTKEGLRGHTGSSSARETRAEGWRTSSQGGVSDCGPVSVKRERSGEMRMGLLGFPFINYSSIPKRVAPSGWCLRAWSSECLNPNVPPLLKQVRRWRLAGRPQVISANEDLRKPPRLPFHTQCCLLQRGEKSSKSFFLQIDLCLLCVSPTYHASG